MTLIWPTTADTHLDDESGDAHILKAGNLGNELLWSKLWKGLMPTSNGSWVTTPFILDNSISLPRDVLEIVTVRGVAVIDGFSVDFRGNSGPLTLALEHDQGHIFLGLQVLYDGDGFVSGYQWNQDLDTPVFRSSQIYIGQARVRNGTVRSWQPVTYPEGWRVATGIVNTNNTPQNRNVALGFQPLRVRLTVTGGGSGKTITAWGFTTDDTGLDGTYEALLFDRT
tara:strand:- start:720 stop:1394 length:675 start_codon:yes stop_codon:yes gene_type:complete